MPYKDKEKARAYNNMKKREYYRKNPSKYNKKRNLYKRKEITKEKQQEYSRRYYLKKQLERIAYRKKYTEEKREEVNEQARRYRREKDPTLAIGDATRSFIRGDIGNVEYCRRVQSCIDAINEKYKVE